MTDIISREKIFEKLIKIMIPYYRKENFSIYLNAFSNEIQEIYNTIYDVRFKTGVETSYGQNLDYVGERIGESRAFSVDLDDGFFSFEGSYFGKGFDEGAFYETSLSSVVSSTREDNIYRAAIKGKITKNHSSGMPEKIIEMVKKMTLSEDVIYCPNYPANCYIYYSSIIDEVTRQYLFTVAQDALPAGVSLSAFENGSDNQLWDYSYWTDGIENDNDSLELVWQ